MAFQIVRGWPSAGALDDALVPATAGGVAAGDVVMLDSNGKAVKADLASGSTNAVYFAIDTDSLGGKIVALKSGFIVETDSLEAGTYNVNDVVTAKAGKFAPISTGEKPVAKVLSYDAATGMAKLAWIAID